MRTPSNKLIFLPGFGFHASIFATLISRIKNQRIHLRDLPINIHINTDNVIATFAQTLPDSAVIAGWSLGGLIAIKLCEKYPERFSKLILLGSSPRFLADTDWPGIQHENAETFVTNAQENLTHCLRRFHKLVCYPEQDPITRARLITHTRHEPDYASTLKYLFATDLREKYAALSQSVLSIAGEHDAVLPTNPASDHIISSAGHTFFYTHAKETSRVINEFLG